MNYNKLLEYSKEEYIELLSRDERDAVSDYTDMLYKPINDGLRKGKNDNNFHVDLIDSAIRKFRFDEPLVVYRNISFYNDKKRKNFMMKLEKGLFHEEGYLSTSLYEPNSLFGNDFSFEINVPAFYRGAYIKELSCASYEYEYLMCRDSNLEIIDIKENKDRTFDSDPKFLVKAKVI